MTLVNDFCRLTGCIAFFSGILARSVSLNHKKHHPLDSHINRTSNDDTDQTAACDYEKPDRISMMPTSRWDYLRPRRAQLEVNYSNSLDF